MQVVTVPIHNPNLDKFINNKIGSWNQQQPRSRYGIIMGFNPETNTATVMLTSINSDVPSEVLKDVPCPVVMGVQTVAPEPGRPCWVVFKGDSQVFPVITHYFNHNYSRFDYKRTYHADNGIPRFMLNM